MFRQEFMSEVNKKCKGLVKSEVILLIDCLFQVIGESLRAGKTIRFHQFATFIPRRRRSGIRYNPYTKKEYRYKEYTGVVVSFNQTFKRMLNENSGDKK